MTIFRDLLRLKLAESLAGDPPVLTRRDVVLPGIPGKAFAVIGVRRGGKTSFLAQCRADRLADGRPREAQLLLSLEDERLTGLTVADLGWRIHPPQEPTGVAWRVLSTGRSDPIWAPYLAAYGGEAVAGIATA